MNRIRAWSNRENFSYRFWTFVRLLNGGSGGLRVGPRGEHSGRENTSSEEEHFVIAGVPLYKPFQMTSRPPSWCPKLIVLKELNSFLTWTLSFVAINLNRWRLSRYTSKNFSWTLLLIRNKDCTSESVVCTYFILEIICILELYCIQRQYIPFPLLWRHARRLQGS